MDLNSEDEPAPAIDIKPECHTELKLDPYTYFKRDQHTNLKPEGATDLASDHPADSKPDLLINLKPKRPTDLEPDLPTDLTPALAPDIKQVIINIQRLNAMVNTTGFRRKERVLQWRKAISREAYLFSPDSIAAEYPDEWMHEKLVRLRSPELSHSSVPLSWMITTAEDRAKMNITAADILWVTSRSHDAHGVLVDVPLWGLEQLWRDGLRDCVLRWKAVGWGTLA
jgi:hypothetical protein